MSSDYNMKGYLLIVVYSIPPIKRGFLYSKARHGDFLVITLKIATVTHEMNFFWSFGGERLLYSYFFLMFN